VPKINFDWRHCASCCYSSVLATCSNAACLDSIRSRPYSELIRVGSPVYVWSNASGTAAAAAAPYYQLSGNNNNNNHNHNKRALV